MQVIDILTVLGSTEYASHPPHMTRKNHEGKKDNSLTEEQVDGEVGEAIRQSGIPRSEIFVTTKFWPHFAAPENVELCLDLILKNMGLDYVDLFLAHWPHALKPISVEALKTAKGGPLFSSQEEGILEEDGKPVIDWEHTSSNIAKQCGRSF